MGKSRAAVLDQARRSLDKPVEIEVLLAKAAQKDRSNVEKHLVALDAEPASARAGAWRRLTRSLATLASPQIATVGQHAIQFFIPDGKYRMQVFALEDKDDGQIAVYIPDVLADALKAKLVSKSTAEGAVNKYAISAAKGQEVQIDPLSGPTEPNPAVHFKQMVGWNRKALRVTLPAAVTPEQLSLVEELGAIAAGAWPPPAAAAS